MTTTWTAPTRVLIERAGPGWEGIWALAYAAGVATVNLASVVPLGLAVDLTLASSDFIAARSALERVRPDLPAWCPAVDLGDIDRGDEDHARHVIDELATAALERLDALVVTDLSVRDLAALTRASGLLFTARAAVTGHLP